MDNASGSISYPLKLAAVTENHAALYEESLKHPEQFWGDLARRRLRWIKEFDQVMDCDISKGHFKWFLGGVINVSGEESHCLRQLSIIIYPLSNLNFLLGALLC